MEDDLSALPLFLRVDDDPPHSSDDVVTETQEDEYEPDLEAFERDRRGFVPPTTKGDEYWYLDFGFRQGWTRLRSTKERLDRRLNLPLCLDVLGTFESPMTPLDRKSAGLLDTGYLGVGRRENDWLTWNFYFGGGAGGDRDKQRWANLNLEVNFDYLIYYTGLTADIYPFGIADHSGRGGFWETLRTSRPYVLTGFEVGYVRAKGWGKLALAPLPLYTDEQKIEDWLFSYLIGAGWEFPINPDWRFVVSGHYTFHFYRPEEYNGWNITYALRYRF
ncbi:MAG: hypothetical protein JSV19_11215 [Phycisphaerales bacterium]|nr:MAG: hypothetical protein JSV19_11215 [Phycisphaerales bacterium]